MTWRFTSFHYPKTVETMFVYSTGSGIGDYLGIRLFLLVTNRLELIQRRF